MWNRTRTTRTAAAATMLLAGLAATACGDDAEAVPDGLAATDLPAFCDAYASTLQAAISGDAAGEVEGLGQMIGSGPASLAEPLGRFRDAIETDGQEAAHEKLGQENLSGVGAVARTCEGNPLEVTAVDYGYEGLPSELPVGRHLISLTNASDVEEHEAIFLRKADGVTTTAQELFQLPEDEVEALIAPVAFLHAGNEAETWVVDFEPGDYIVVCFLPVGGDDAAPPHMVEGMLAEFTVSE